MDIADISQLVGLLLNELELKVKVFTVMMTKGMGMARESGISISNWNSLQQKHNLFFLLTFIERIQRML